MNTLLNIPIRTSGRPNYFKRCLDTITSQTYQNYRIIVSVDDDFSEEYVRDFGITDVIRVYRRENTGRIYRDYRLPNVIRRHAPYNLYLNALYEACSDGYIVGMDDDDGFASPYSLEVIAKNITSDNQLLFWRVRFPNGGIIPSDDVWGLEPMPARFSGLGMAYPYRYGHNKMWDEWTFCDVLVARELYGLIKDKVYINKVLSFVQREKPNGLGQRDDIKL